MLTQLFNTCLGLVAKVWWLGLWLNPKLAENLEVGEMVKESGT